MLRNFSEIRTDVCSLNWGQIRYIYIDLDPIIWFNLIAIGGNGDIQMGAFNDITLPDFRQRSLSRLGLPV